MRQQRLLEKVANISSSPINVLQSIAAKALNFKIKNSQNWVRGEGSSAPATAAALTSGVSASTSSLNSLLNSDTKAGENAASKLSLINYNRLVRQYKFLKSTNIKLNNQTDDKAKHLLFLNQLVNSQILNDRLKCKQTNNLIKGDTSKKAKPNENPGDDDDDDEDDDEDDEQEIFNNKMFLVKSNEKLEKMEHQEGVAEGSASFQMPIEINSERNKEEPKANEVSDVDMESQSNTNQPGTSKSFMNENMSNANTIVSNDQAQQSSNLFTALKFWMSKRVDSLSSSSPGKTLSLNKKDATSIDMNLQEELATKLESVKESKRKSKKKLKTMKSM
jgi:hypothetical protein